MVNYSCCLCNRPEVADDETDIVLRDANYWLQSIYDILLPRGGVEYSIILLPSLNALLLAMFFNDLSISGDICNDYDTICDEVFTLSWWSALYRPNIVQGDNYITVFSYALHHANLPHILLNILMLNCTLAYLEKKYGVGRMLVQTLITAVGAALFGLWFYADDIVFGFSGVSYGYMATIIADNILNYEHNRGRIWAMLLSAGIIVSIVLDYQFFTGVAALAHVGGVTAGLCLGFLVLPTFCPRPWKRVFPIVSLVAILLHFVLLPCILFNVIHI